MGDVLDRVLNKGIVISGYHRYALGGVDLGDIKSRMVVMSLSTYLDRGEFLDETELVPAKWLRGSEPVQTKRVRIMRRVPRKSRLIPKNRKPFPSLSRKKES
jgi:hypothetical protein